MRGPPPLFAVIRHNHQQLLPNLQTPHFYAPGGVYSSRQSIIIHSGELKRLNYTSNFLVSTMIPHFDLTEQHFTTVLLYPTILSLFNTEVKTSCMSLFIKKHNKISNGLALSLHKPKYFVNIKRKVCGNTFY